MSMVSITLLFAALFLALGIGGWTATGMESPTALIPAGFGVVFGILAMLARKEAIRKHIMHAAAMLALLGFFGSVRGLMALPGLLSGGEVERPAAVIAQAIMAVLCLILEGLYVRSFIAARRAGKV